MTKLSLYLLEVNALLAFFYLIYVVVLRKETFFSFNRFYLLGILVFSLLFPLLSFEVSPIETTAVGRPIEQISKLRMSYYEAMASWEFEARNSTLSADEIQKGEESRVLINWMRAAYYSLILVYGIGVIVCLTKLIWTLRWIFNMMVDYPEKNVDGTSVISIPYPVAPFSFFSAVFAYEKLVERTEFDHIRKHEEVHIRQKHSIDLVFVQLLAAFLWFNPMVWRLIKSLKTVHEYIADRKMINQGYSLVEYQTLLLSQLISNNSYGLVHNFNLSFIKKRITMMTNKKSGSAGRVKVSLAMLIAVLFSAFIVQCNSNVEQEALLSEKSVKADFVGDIDLPVLPETGFKFSGDENDVLNLVIGENRVMINGQVYGLDQLERVMDESGLTERGAVLLRVDRDQQMALVRDVMWELRKANHRRLLHVGQGHRGKGVELPLLLPPVPENASGGGLPTIDEKYLQEHDLDLLKVDLAGNLGTESHEKVYAFVKAHVERQSDKYVVSAKYDDEVTYNDYLVNLTHIYNAFTKIYQERAQEMFGEDFYKLDEEKYRAVRKGVPRAISIAEG